MRQVGVSKLLLAIVVAVALVFCAAVALSVPTKPESYVTDNMTEAINFSINSSVSLRNVTFNWNGTNYTFYDDSLLCLVNFNQSDTLGDTASKAVDVSRYGNNITLRGTSTWTSNGKYGSGIYFDGATTYGELPLSMVGGLTRFSVAFWIRTAESGTSVNFYQCPHMFGQESTGAPSHDFGIYTYNGFIGFWSGLAPGGDVNYRSTTTKINNGMWHHVVVSNDGSNAYLYVDGAYESSIGTGLSMTQAPFLGGLNSGNSTVIEHKGTYDEFMFWNRPLSASEITMLYRTNLYKYASDKWVLYINQSVSVPYGRAGYSYSATVLDGDDVTNTTEIRNITFQPLSQAGLFSSSIRNNGLTTASAVPINASINSSDLYNLTLDWNGTVHTLYDSSLVLALDFDNVAAIGDSSTNVTDLSRYNHSVTMANATYTDGAYGQAVRLIGANQFVRITDSQYLRPSSAITLSGWVRLDKYSGCGRVISKDQRADGTWNDPWLSYALAFDCATGKFPEVCISTAGSGTLKCVDANASLVLGSWYHLVGVYDGAYVRVYVDGREINKAAKTGAINYSKPNLVSDVLVGTSTVYTGSNFDNLNGSVDELRIWNRALTPAEVQQLYYTHVYKYGKNYWGAYVLQAVPLPSGSANYSFSLTGKDTAGNNASTETANIAVEGMPSIGFTAGTPAEGAVWGRPVVAVNVSINTSALGNVLFNWNGATYTMFNSSVSAIYNFDSVGALREYGSNTYIADASGNGHNGTFSSASMVPTTYSEGRYGPAVSFDGASNNVNISNWTPMANGQVTFSAWVKPRSPCPGNCYVITKGNDDTANSYGIHTSAAGAGVMTYGSSPKWTLWNGSLPIDRWTHIAGVVSGSESYFYVNGVFVASGPVAGTIAPSAQSLWIGGQSRAGYYYRFNGSIDEAYIFNRSLSASEVQQLYYSSLYRTDADKFVFYSAQPLPIPYGSSAYSFWVSANDTALNSNTTGTRNITFFPDRSIAFSPPTPSSGNATVATTVTINTSVNFTALSNLTFNWDGANYTVYDGSLVVLYNFNNVSALGENGSSVIDLSRYGHNGTFKALSSVFPSYTEGKYGKAASIGAQGDFIDIANVSLPSGAQPRTVSFWFKSGWAVPTSGCIFGYGGQAADLAFGVFQNASATAGTYTMMFSSWGPNTFYSNRNLSMDVWYHVAVTYNGSEVAMFINGEYDNQNTSTITLNTHPAAAYIGVWLPQNYYMNGSIDDFMLWNRSLSRGDIRQLYHSSLSKYDYNIYTLYSNQSGLGNGTFSYSVFANDTAGNSNSTETRAITIGSPYNFRFIHDSLSYYPNQSFLENDFVQFNATLNVTTNETINLNVTLFMDGAYANATTFVFTQNETRGISVGWSARPGNFTATLWADPNGQYLESDKSDNNITITGVYAQNATWVVLVSPLNDTYVVRGKTTSPNNNEDAWRVVNNITTLVGNVSNYFHPQIPANASCVFYFASTLVGINTTDPNGICYYSFDHSIFDAGAAQAMVNYSLYTANATSIQGGASSNITLTLNIINSSISPLNTRQNGNYIKGDAVVTNLTFYNDSVPFDPGDFELYIGGSTGMVCPYYTLPDAASAWAVLRKSDALSHQSAGNYVMKAVLNDSANEALHWCLYVNGSGANLISSGSHQDIGVDAATTYLNISLFDGAGNPLPSASVLLYDRNGYLLINRTNGSEIYRPGARYDNYALQLMDNATNSIYFTNLNATLADVRIPFNFVYPYAGTRPFNGSGVLTPMPYLANNVFFSYDDRQANITIAKNGLKIRKLYKCEVYDPATQNCTAWDSTPIYANYGENDTHVWFTVSSFSGYAGGPDGSNLAIWDTNDTGAVAKVNRTIYFYANYSNSTGTAINDGADHLGNCTIDFSDQNAFMAYNSTSTLYWFSRNFTAAGNYTWNVSCNSSGFSGLNATDNVSITTGPQPVMTVPVLSPSLIYKNTTVYCNSTITDGDDPSGLTVQFEFYNWSGNIYNATNTSVMNNSVVWAILPGQYFVKANNLSCRARGYDGTSYGEWSQFSNNVTVLNSPPFWNPDPSVVPANSTAGSEYFLHCSDNDSDIITYSINDTLAGKLALKRSDGNLSWAVFNESEAHTYDMNYSCSDDQINVSYYGIYQINDTTMPFSFREENSSNPVYRLSNMSFNISFTDWKGGDTAVFYFDDGVGSFSNYSTFSWRDEINRNFSVNRTVNALTAMTVRWYWWANDTYNNINTSVEHSFVVPNRKPSNATIADIIFNEDTNYTLNLSLFFNDTDGERLNYSVNISSTDSSHNVNYTFWEIGDNVTLVPAPDYYCSEWVIFQAKDNANDTNQSNNITISVLSVPDPPRFNNITVYPSLPTDLESVRITVNVSSEAGVSGTVSCISVSTVSALDGLSGSATAGTGALVRFYTAYIPAGNSTINITCTDANGPRSQSYTVEAVAAPTDLYAYQADLRFDPTNPNSGSLFATTLFVRNLGPHNATNVNVSFYQDGTYAASVIIPYIDASSNATSPVALLSYSTTGTHLLMAHIDPNNQTVETSKANNQVSRTLKVGQSSLSKLINITLVNASPVNYMRDRIYPYDYFHVSGYASYVYPYDGYMVQGGAVTVTYNGTNYTGYTGSNGYFNVDGLQAGSTAGTYEYLVNISDGNAYGDEFKEVIIYPNTGCAYPDYLPNLLIASPSYIYLNSTLPVANSTYNLTAIFSNSYCGSNGTAPGDFSSSFNVSVYEGMTRLQKFTIYKNVSNDGGAWNVSLLWTPTSTGSKTIRVLLDEDNQIPESDETNLFSRSFMVYSVSADLSTTSIIQYDPSVSNISASYLAFATRPATYVFTVYNQGAFGSSDYDFTSYANSSVINATTGNSIGGLGSRAYFQSFFTQNSTGTVNISGSTHTNDINDSNLLNNNRSAVFYTYVKPDLRITDAAMFPNTGSPATDKNGSANLSVNLTIENFGVIPIAGPFNISICKYADYACTDLVEYQYNGTIDANFTSISVIWLNYTNLGPGDHYIRAMVDSRNQVDEIYDSASCPYGYDYTANCYAFAKFNISYNTPRLGDASSLSSANTPYQGNPAYTNLTLRNTGSATAYNISVNATYVLPDGTNMSVYLANVSSIAMGASEVIDLTFSPPLPHGKTIPSYLRAIINYSSENFEINTTYLDVRYPEAYITSDDVVFSADTVYIGRSVNITAYVHNADQNHIAYNVTANLSLNGVNINATVIPSILGGNIEIARFNFTVGTEGYQLAQVSVNELWKTYETNAFNNVASKATLFVYNNSAPLISFHEFSNNYISGTKLFMANITDYDNATSLFNASFYWINLTDSSKNPMFVGTSPLTGYGAGNVSIPPGAYFGNNYSTALLPDGAYRFFVNTTDLNATAESISSTYIVDNTPPRLNISSPSDGSMINSITDVVYNANDTYPYELKWRFSNDSGATYSSYVYIYFYPTDGPGFDGINKNFSFNPNVCGDVTTTSCIVQLYMSDMAGTTNTSSISLKTKNEDTTTVVINPPDPPVEPASRFAGSANRPCAPGNFTFQVSLGSGKGNVVSARAKLYKERGDGVITSKIGEQGVPSSGEVAFTIDEAGHYILEISKAGFSSMQYLFTIDQCYIPNVPQNQTANQTQNHTIILTPEEEIGKEERPPFIPPEYKPEQAPPEVKPEILPPFALPAIEKIIPMIAGVAKTPAGSALLLAVLMLLALYAYWLRKYRSLNLREFFNPQNLPPFFGWLFSFGGLLGRGGPPKQGGPDAGQVVGGADGDYSGE